MLMTDCPVSYRNTAKFEDTQRSLYVGDGYLTKAQISRAEKAHNKAVQKKMSQLWCIPRVQFSGGFYNQENSSLDVNNWLTHYEQEEEYDAEEA